MTLEEFKEAYKMSNYDEEYNKELIVFNKRFADGEQYLYYRVLNSREDWEKEDPETREFILDIKEEGKDFYWQENAVYNIIPLYISRFTRESKILSIFGNSQDLIDTTIYGKLGLVDMLVPFQRAFNAAKNRKMEFLNRYTMGVVCVEDGSVDTDDLEIDGLAPGKIIVYRQGSNAPEFKLVEGDVYQFTKAEDDIRDDMDRICNEFIDRYSILPPANVRIDEDGDLDLSQWISTTNGEMNGTKDITVK